MRCGLAINRTSLRGNKKSLRLNTGTPVEELAQQLMLGGTFIVLGRTLCIRQSILKRFAQNGV